MSRWPARAAGVVTVLLSGAACASGAGAQTGSGRWRADERVLIADVSEVRALARSFDRLYAATDGGLIAYDDRFGRFDLPLTREDGYPERPVTAMVYDERDGSLWLASADGRLLQFDPRARRFRENLVISERITALVPAGAGGADLFARTRRGWLRFDPFRRRFRPAAPADVAAARERNPDLRARDELIGDPGFQAVRDLMGMGVGARAYPVTDVMPAVDASTAWVATAGNFLFRYDRYARRWDAVVYGPLGSGAAGVVLRAGRLWIVPRTPENGRYGVARADAELQHWERWDADSSRAVPGGRMRAVVASARGLWVGGEDGLYRFSEPSGTWREIRPAGVASARVEALADAGEGGVWIGTDRGAARLGPDGSARVASLLPADRISAILAVGDRVWIGTRRGLYSASVPNGEGLELEPGPGPLAGYVGALAASLDTLFAGLGPEVWRREPGGIWSRVEAVGRLGGTVSALAVSDGVLWAGSAEGLVRWDARENEVNRIAFASGDLPSGREGRGITGIAPISRREAWIATPAGALRLRADF
ncbi:MAG: hypothetical protein ACE5HF_01015 [Gemmatimonadota bacterium]